MDQESPAQEQPSLSLSDLVVLLNLVRLASERGAIRADELSAVGATYDRLFKFLESSGVINRQSNESIPPSDQEN